MNIPPHALFCPPGSVFYDAVPDDGPDFAPVVGPAPEGWLRHTGVEWVTYRCTGQELPQQGWKIHVSATQSNAEEILSRSAAHCFAQGVTFKHLRGPRQVARRNWKYADRTGSGKLITIYPHDEATFATVLHGLSELLEGQAGPYILSDLRWRDGPLYVRYGAFTPMVRTGPSGERILCVVDPDGELVPDARRPGFHPPAWAGLPDLLHEAIEARNAGVLRDFPYRVERALHYSNGGGVYRGTDTRTGLPVLLREARPHAGTDPGGRDAVARLEQEKAALERLHGLDCVPTVLEHRIGHEHHYLVREYVPGQPWHAWVMSHHPMLRHADPSPADLHEYGRQARELLDRLTAGLAQIHARSVVLADLHPGNVLVRDDGTLAFIDLESANDAGAEDVQELGAPGFVAPGGTRGPAVDRYALSAMTLWTMVPATGALTWGRDKLGELLRLALQWFPGLTDLADRVAACLPADDDGPAGSAPLARPAAALGEPLTAAGSTTAVPDTATVLTAAGSTTAVPDTATVEDDLITAILDSAEPHRTDRLFPGDARQFLAPGGGVTLAFGAAGVLWALAEAGVPTAPGHTVWLLDAADRLEEPDAGLYSGLAGVALALDRVGRADAALEIARTLPGRAAASPDRTLWSGAAGTGLTALHLGAAHADADLLDFAESLAAGLLDAGDGGPRPSGLLHGRAGEALFLLRLHEHTGADRLLEAAHALLVADAHANAEVRQTAGPNAGPLHGIGRGASGIALVAAELRPHRPDPELDSLLQPFLLPPALHAEGGLLHGQPGLMVAARELGKLDDRGLVRQLDALRLHLVRHGRGLSVLGEQGMRLSHDLTTGAAGVLLALRGVRLGTGTGIPGLQAVPRAAAAARPEVVRRRERVEVRP